MNKNLFIGLTVASFLWSCQKGFDKTTASPTDAASLEINTHKTVKDFEQVNLVGDNNDFNPLQIDANIINAWGIAFPTSGPAWVTAFGTGQSGIYNGNGTSARPAVSIPSPTASTGGHPTGVVFNSTTDFKLPNGNPARFIFAQADGLISGWNGGNEAVKATPATPGAVYLGIALASDNGNNYLYLANFSEGKIEVYDKDWNEVSMPFTDPTLPQGYTPLNIQNIDGKLYVMYGQPGSGNDVISPRNGFVDIYNSDGSFIKRFVTQGQLNAPWGITKAPKGFWGADTDNQDIFLVGNFGDGHINAFDSEGVFQGQLRAHGNPIIIDRLWGIAFAPASSGAFDHNQLFFAAGPGVEQHGLFGFIKK